MRWMMAPFVVFLGGTALAQTGDQAAGEDLGNKLLSFIQSAAELLGRGLINLVNLILPAGREVSTDLTIPLGYLGLLTLVLFLFGVIEAARKVIWIIVGVGWVLMLVRIVLDALAS
ncbi:MAG: hypothetical protein XD60_1792 [Acetothermia bacterium 64_32]|nr:MAG: hypothetical protein XD60_1792 [Acetothermia bacterium 64_32]HAF71438.1 hypothetical protein [Candidatus Acetothermia bacterium]